VLNGYPALAPNNNPAPAIPYKACVAAALYNELTSIQAYTNKANSDLGKTYGVGLGLLGPAAFLKYGIGGSAVTGGGLLTSYLAGAFAKAYFVTVPSFASGVSQAANQYNQDVKACGGS